MHVCDVRMCHVCVHVPCVHVRVHMCGVCMWYVPCVHACACICAHVRAYTSMDFCSVEDPAQLLSVFVLVSYAPQVSYIVFLIQPANVLVCCLHWFIRSLTHRSTCFAAGASCHTQEPEVRDADSDALTSWGVNGPGDMCQARPAAPQCSLPAHPPVGAAEHCGVSPHVTPRLKGRRAAGPSLPSRGAGQFCSVPAGGRLEPPGSLCGLRNWKGWDDLGKWQEPNPGHLGPHPPGKAPTRLHMSLSSLESARGSQHVHPL